MHSWADSEKDLSEILQIEQVFSNVSKGAVAKREDWEKAFNTTEMSKVVEEVLQLADPLNRWADI
jgi:ribosome maturation protein SDO1